MYKITESPRDFENYQEENIMYFDGSINDSISLGYKIVSKE